MSCEIIQISAFTRSARPVSDKQPAAEGLLSATVFSRRGSCGAQESRNSRRRRPKPPKTPASGSRVATPGGLPAW
jgi:hypothetical protein